MINKIFAFFLLLPFTLSNGYHSEHSFQTHSLEDKAVKKVKELYEVKKFMITAKASKPTLMVVGTPGKDCKFYWIQLGPSNMERFRPTYNFYFDPKTLKIYYVDFMADNEHGEARLTIEQWR